MAKVVTQIKKSLYLFSTVNEATQFFANMANNHYVVAHPVVYCTGNNTVYYNFSDSNASTRAISVLEPQPVYQ